MPAFKNAKADELAFDTARAWIDPKTGKKPTPMKIANANTPQKLVNELESIVGKGERHHLGFDWLKSEDGHIVCIEKDSSGALFLYDPQSAKIISGQALEQYFHGVCLTSAKTKDVPDILRVDNLDLNKEYADAVLRSAV